LEYSYSYSLRERCSYWYVRISCEIFLCVRYVLVPVVYGFATRSIVFVLYASRWMFVYNAILVRVLVAVERYGMDVRIRCSNRTRTLLKFVVLVLELILELVLVSRVINSYACSYTMQYSYSYFERACSTSTSTSGFVLVLLLASRRYSYRIVFVISYGIGLEYVLVPGWMFVYVREAILFKVRWFRVFVWIDPYPVRTVLSSRHDDTGCDLRSSCYILRSSTASRFV